MHDANMTHPEITVVIPTYNRAAGLPKTLERIFSQSISHTRYRVILVDNRSIDNTAVVAKILCNKFPTLTYAYQDRPGAGAARNLGIKLAKTQLVLFIDDDILASHNLIEQHLNAHKTHVGSVLGYLEVPWERSRDPFLKYLHKSEEQNTYSKLDPANTSYHFFYTGNVSCRKEALLKAGGFDEGFTVYGVEDIDLGYRLETYGEPMIFCKQALAFHDYHPTFQLFIKKRRMAGRSLAYFLDKFPNLQPQFTFNKYPFIFIVVPHLLTRWMAPTILRKSDHPLSFLQYVWLNRAFRYAMFRGYSDFCRANNQLGMSYIGLK